MTYSSHLTWNSRCLSVFIPVRYLHFPGAHMDSFGVAGGSSKALTQSKNCTHGLPKTYEINELPNKYELAATCLIPLPLTIGNIALYWLITG